MDFILILFLGIFLIFTILKGILDDETDRLLVKFNNFNTRLIEEKLELYSRIDNRNKFVYEQQEKIKEQEELIERFTNLLNGNKHNSETLIIAKLKELVSDYQSIN